MEGEATNGTQETKPRREYGTGRIWLVGKTWWVQYYVNGRQVRESSRSKGKVYAERLLKRRLAEKEAGLLPTSGAHRLRYENMREALLANYRMFNLKSLMTRADGSKYICGVAQLDEFFAGYRAVNISNDRILAFVEKRQAQKTPNGTINRSLAALRRMFYLAKKGGKVRDVPHIPMLKEPPPRKGFLEYEDFRRLREHLPEYMRPVLTLAFYTGMRLGEIRSLRWQNVNFLDAQIRLDPGTTKNDEPRVIPLTSEVLDMLKIERQRNLGEFVFSRDGRPLGNFRKSWVSACVRTGLGATALEKDEETGRVCKVYRGLIFHDLRRTGVRNLVRAGVPERVAMAISGHKTRAVFERYNIVSERDLKDAARRLDNYIAGEKGANSGQVATEQPAKPELTN